MALFEKPDLEKLKSQRNYARLIDWANYTKQPALSSEARRLIESDPYGLAEYLYETVEWTRKNSGHSGRRLPRRGLSLIRQVTTMAATIGEPMLAPLEESLRVYDKYGDPDIKTRLLYYNVVFDIFLRMGAVAGTALESLSRAQDPDVRKLAQSTLADLPEDEPEEDEEWGEWDDEEDDEVEDEEDDEDAAGGDGRRRDDATPR
jgi:hypothetical protein